MLRLSITRRTVVINCYLLREQTSQDLLRFTKLVAGSPKQVVRFSSSRYILSEN